MNTPTPSRDETPTVCSVMLLCLVNSSGIVVTVVTAFASVELVGGCVGPSVGIAVVGDDILHESVRSRYKECII